MSAVLRARAVALVSLWFGAACVDPPAPAAAPIADGSADPPLPDRLTDAVGRALAPPNDVDSLLADLQKLREETSTRERPLVERAIRLVSSSQSGTAVPATTVSESMGLLRDLADLYPENQDLQVKMVSSMAAMVVIAQNLGVDASPIRDEARTRAAQLLARFPNEGRAHALLAYPSLAGDDELEVIGHLKRCVELSPPGAKCQEAYQSAVARYQRPRCSSGSVRRDLKMVLAIRREPGAPRERSTRYPIETPAGELDVDAIPIFGASGVVEIVDDGGSLTLTLTPAARERLRDATARLDALEHWAVLKLGERGVWAGRVTGPIPDGVLTIDAIPSATLDRLCTSVLHPVLQTMTREAAIERAIPAAGDALDRALRKTAKRNPPAHQGPWVSAADVKAEGDELHGWTLTWAHHPPAGFDYEVVASVSPAGEVTIRAAQASFADR